MPTLLDRLRAFVAPPAAPALPALVEHKDSVFNSLTGLGGWSDKGQVARPNPYTQPLTLWELRTLYAHNGISRRIVDVVPSRACRRGWSVSAPGADAEAKRLGIYQRTQEAASWARLYGAAVVVMITDDGLPLDEPLDLVRVRNVDALQVFDAVEATPCAWSTDIRSPRFRLPEMWQIGTQGFRARVHASRCVHFRGTLRPPSESSGSYGGNGLPDDSCLQSVWDEIRRLTETLQGGAILAQELRESVLKLGDLPASSTGDEADAIEAKLSLLSRSKSVLGIMLLAAGDTYENRSNPPTGFDQLSSAGWEALAAVTGIPQVILMGSTPGGLNTDGESSWEGFRQLVSSYQEDRLRDPLEQIYAVVLAAMGYREPWALTFAALDEPNETTIAATRAQVATTDQVYVAMGVYSPDDVRAARFGADGWAIDLVAAPPAPAALPTAPAPTPKDLADPAL